MAGDDVLVKTFLAIVVGTPCVVWLFDYLYKHIHKGIKKMFKRK